MFADPVTLQEIAGLLDLQTINSIIDVANTNSNLEGLADFIDTYTAARYDIAEIVLERWNKTLALYVASNPNVFAETCLRKLKVLKQTEDPVMQIHKVHVKYMMQSLALHEYKAIMALRFHASLIAKVNQTCGEDGGIKKHDRFVQITFIRH
ncbi:hypothetical protein HDU83_008963 [Entophlyctis luteolus]|nr:hypothetical protein HDU83_008963 [Entophlyctis luteolus]